MAAIDGTGTDSLGTTGLPSSPKGKNDQFEREDVNNQLIYLAAVNAVVVAVVLAVYHTARPVGHADMTMFYALEVAIFILSVFLRGLVPIVEGAESIGQGSLGSNQRRTAGPNRFVTYWDQQGTRYLKRSVVVLSALMVFAFGWLVYATGGGLHSPFMPFLEAPAVMGPFVARHPTGIALSVTGVLIAMVIEMLLKHPGHLRFVHDRAAHVIVMSVVLLTAGGISWMQKRAENKRPSDTPAVETPSQEGQASDCAK